MKRVNPKATLVDKSRCREISLDNGTFASLRRSLVVLSGHTF